MKVAWLEEGHDGIVYLTLSDFIKIRLRSLLFS